MKEVRFVDTTLRDGQMSLWATGMTTGMILPVADKLDQAGFDAIEVFANGMEKKLVRELGEDPWERLDLISKRITKTPLRFIRSRYTAAFHITPRAIEELWYQRIAAHGVKQIRTADPSNTVAGWREKVRDARNVGIDVIINLVFSISPKHTDEYYAQRARAAAEIGPYRICLKDPGALLTPERVRTLAPLVLKSAGAIPVEFHTHCITGLGTLCCVEAMNMGIKIINTAIPPLAHASSNPSVFSVAKNAHTLGHTPVVDENSLRLVEKHFSAMARRAALPIGAPADYDAAHLIHQVPGGMISNLRHQLSNAGLGDKIDAVLDEIGRVRADLGYPMMLTPYSQFVGVQATLNVISGERYKLVSDELIQYALGFWGEEESSSIDPDIKDRILGQPRARELIHWKPPQPSLKELREEFGGTGVSDDELLLRYFAGNEHVTALRKRGARIRTERAGTPLLDLVQELKNRPNIGLFQVRKDAFSLTIRREREAS